MRRRRGLLALPPSILVLALAGSPPADAAESGSTVTCTQSATTTTTTAVGVEVAATSPPAGPTSGNPCWVDVDPYPFGSEGIPIKSAPQRCSPVFKGEAPPGSECALTVTSIAFRAWNRGLAATDTSEGPGVDANNPYGIWIFNGSSWYPSPGFPGYSVCPGHAVVWSGKLDYWLIGGPSDVGWSRLCRFDGATLEWESLELPAATRQHVTVVSGSEERRRPGGITSAACFAWDNCWFFGTYGTVVHWDGTQLSDASPDPSLKWLQGEYTAAVARRDPRGNSFGVAVGATAEFHNASSMSEVLSEHEGAPPPEMQASNGGPFAPLPFTPPTSQQEHDPYRTDLVAVDFDAAGEGWVAGNPAGLRAASRHEFRPASPSLPPPPSPLVPVSTSGASTTCAGPAEGRFTFTPPAFNPVEPPNSFLWSSIAVIPGSGEALAGGSLLPRKEGAEQDPNARPLEGEPVIAQAACDGTTTVTRFHVEDPTYSGSPPKPLAPADREGYVSAIAANATNDAWAATTPGSLTTGSGGALTSVAQPPHLYRLTDGANPDAPEGDDLEERPLELQLDPPIVVLEPPPPPPPPPPPAAVTTVHRVKLPPAIYGVKARLHGKHRFSLYLSFRVRRPITVGAQALRRGRIVSEVTPRRFTGHRGLLILKLDRKRWPTKVRFVA